jgi:hypothetical protein
MNFKEVRLKFRELSGRFDLCTEAGVDSGADFFINYGQRHLDRLADIHKSRAVIYTGVAIGSWNVQLSNCRSIKEVWCSTTTEKWRLEKANFRDLIQSYFSQRIALSDQGSPLYYCPVTSRTSTGGEDLSGYTDIVTSSDTLSTLIFAPANDEIVVIEVHGNFYHADLSDDEDENFWTTNYPDILLMSALRKMEAFNRNTQGVNDFDHVIASELMTLNYDLIDEQAAEADQMEG